MVSKSRCRLFGLDIDNLSMGETLTAVERLVRTGRPGLVVTPNAQHISVLRRDAEFRAAYAGADVIVADGLPLIWLSRLIRCPLKERVAGADILPAFAAVAARKGYRLAFLGAAPGIAARAAEILAVKNPGLRVVMTLSPPVGFHDDPVANASVVAAIKKAGPDVLFVGLGTPKGEVWAWKNKAAAGVPATVCVGAAFDFITGVQKRAPLAMQQAGLEWIYRLFRDPYRLWKRYTLGNIHFLYLGALEAALSVLRRSARSRIDKGRD
ncbi:MAG: WecB/TagA/CpsF family glycosyltransferase [Candidatus Aminicenantes bacterium]|nr:WecB/TagA/CpsF family glycosyltransferase [Candidatus Aminicenantes bacterium]